MKLGGRQTCALFLLFSFSFTSFSRVCPTICLAFDSSSHSLTLLLYLRSSYSSFASILLFLPRSLSRLVTFLPSPPPLLPSSLYYYLLCLQFINIATSVALCCLQCIYICSFSPMMCVFGWCKYGESASANLYIVRFIWLCWHGLNVYFVYLFFLLFFASICKSIFAIAIETLKILVKNMDQFGNGTSERVHTSFFQSGGGRRGAESHVNRSKGTNFQKPPELLFKSLPNALSKTCRTILNIKAANLNCNKICQNSKI